MPICNLQQSHFDLLVENDTISKLSHVHPILLYIVQ